MNVKVDNGKPGRRVAYQPVVSSSTSATSVFSLEEQDGGFECNADDGRGKCCRVARFPLCPGGPAWRTRRGGFSQASHRRGNADLGGAGGRLHVAQTWWRARVALARQCR